LEWLVFSLFKDGHISSGKAARLLELTRVEFLALLRRRGVAYVDYSPTELAEEVAAVRALVIEPGAIRRQGFSVSQAVTDVILEEAGER
ncbi:UPF0175 family protein, partial [Arthrospira platensis SPKY2]